ncbi:E3 ubiquitin-protein ligase TRIM56-like [Acanthaster planci]|uniref:E3 ubiquitin-protein ligase TRIM56-like n=1 Tax=Acanthaster planci TaxID=133434 RepID=A0A8B7Z2R4_ACAPL|nr:E3 ubiquitin-protein ligase TRIM56-like [Acanthaster planci]XP_022099065.1 E3 ubiquitin-protein ligase TRIM56-like [Acanthaster planci]
MASNTSVKLTGDSDQADRGKGAAAAWEGKTSSLIRNSSRVSEKDEFERDSGDLSVCFLCEGNLRNPKLLPCLHSFCKDCLLKLVRENETSAPIPCPLCRDGNSAIIDDVERLVDNTLMSSLQELKLVKGEPDMNLEQDDISTCEVKCTSCRRSNPATCRCTYCQDFLCETCRLSHQRLKILQHHELIKLDAWIQQTSKVEYKFCPQHSGEPISFYCQPCKVLACKDCIDLDHQNPHHNTCSLLEGAVLCRRTIDKLLTVSRQTEAKFKGAWEILNSMKAELTETTNSLRHEVRDAFKSERDILDEREKEFLTKIDVIEKQREDTVNTHIDRVETILEKLWTAFDMAEILMENGNDFHVLSLEPIVCKRLQSLYKMSPELPNSNLTLIDLTEEQKTDPEEPNSVPQAQAKDMIDTPVWELETSLGDRGSGKGQFDWCKGVAASLDSHAVVADWGNDRVQVFDEKRQFVCVLNSTNHEEGKLSMPHDVACLLDGRFVVIDKSNYAKIYCPKGNFLDRFLTLSEDDTPMSAVELSCVTVDRRSRILIGDCKRNLITVHYVDGKMIKTIPAVGPEHITTTSKDLLVVSCPRKQKVRVMNHDGRFIFQIETYGAGEKLKPRGVACDDEDNIYVVHKERGGEKSVHVFDSNGEYVACVAKNLREPYDVDIAPGGRVIVSDDDALKIFTRRDKE